MLRTFLVAALLLIAGAACTGQLLAALLAGSAPAAAQRFYPGGGDAAAKAVAARLDALTPANAPAAIAAAARLLRRAPMADVPLAVAGQAFTIQGDMAAADAAMAALRARSPRNRMGRAWAAEEALKAGRYREAMIHADVLMALYPEKSGAILDWLVAVAANPRSHDALRAQIGTHPAWADAFVRKLGATAPDSALTYDLNRLVPAAQSAYLSRLARDGRYEEAFLAWLDFLPSGQRVVWPYDSAFKGSPGAPPFNWTLEGDGAEYARGGGLYTVFRGRRSGVIAAQIMLLGAGDYRLEAVMDGETRARGGAFRWTLTCLPADAPLAALQIRDLVEGKPRRYLSRFSVPPTGCGVQRLALEGVSGELPLWAKALTHTVAITPEDAPTPERAGSATLRPAAAGPRNGPGASPTKSASTGEAVPR